MPEEIVGWCGVPDHVGTSASKWPDGNITWTITDSVPGVPDDELQAIIADQMDRWAAVCGIKPIYVTSARTARILVTHRDIDGPMNVLAETELPQPGLAQVHLWFDSEAWVDSETPGRNKISINIVGLHELGHALGLGHCTSGESAVMAPIYNPSINVPQAWDIQQVQTRYGRPVVTPAPAPNPVPTPVPTPAPTPGGFMGGNLAMLLQLLAQLGPLLTWIKSSGVDLATIISVLQKIAGAFSSKPAPVQAVLLGMSHDEFQTSFTKAADLFSFIASLTPTTLDDTIAGLFSQAVKTAWLMDFFYSVLSGQVTLTGAMLAEAHYKVLTQTA